MNWRAVGGALMLLGAGVCIGWWVWGGGTLDSRATQIGCGVGLLMVVVGALQLLVMGSSPASDGDKPASTTDIQINEAKGEHGQVNAVQNGNLTKSPGHSEGR
ncbi:MAG TPA: hypothetical protein PLX71_05960 [Phycicoccus sp.]|nr:hypothetical protein [Phycicoccus sp.]